MKFAEAGDAVLVHRLVQEVARGRGPSGRPQPPSCPLALNVDSILPPSVMPQDVRSWPVWTPLAPHVAAVTLVTPMAPVSPIRLRA